MSPPDWLPPAAPPDESRSPTGPPVQPAAPRCRCRPMPTGTTARRLSPIPAAPSCAVHLSRCCRIRPDIDHRAAAAPTPGQGCGEGRRPGRRSRRRAGPCASGRFRAAARTHRGEAQARRCAVPARTAVADWSTPSAGMPRRTRCATNRPGPQPKSIVGPWHIPTTARSNMSSAPRPPSQLCTGNACTRPSSWRSQHRSPVSARSYRWPSTSASDPDSRPGKPRVR